MANNRVTKFIIGIALALVFAVFGYLSCHVAVHSSEVDGTASEQFGYNREKYLASGRTVVREVTETPQPVSTPQPEKEEPEAAEPAEAENPADERPEAMRAAEKGLPAPPEIDILDWQYMLVNKHYNLPSDYVPELVYLDMVADSDDIQTDYNPNRCPVDKRIAEALLKMAKDCKNAGVDVYLSSGYRSYSEQNSLLERKIGQGYSYDEAITIVAAPGTSEHQTGLVCDITDFYRELKDSSLADTETFKWLEAHCADYGFVVRYPLDKSGSADSITGIITEPWHFRYVGEEVAKYMMDNNLCLEEFWDLYYPGALEGTADIASDYFVKAGE